jgi:hypothetical protein
MKALIYLPISMIKFKYEYQDLYDVVLVDHRYGGIVIGGVVEKIPDGIKSMIFLDAYIPQDGKSAFDVIPGLRED